MDSDRYYNNEMEKLELQQKEFRKKWEKDLIESPETHTLEKVLHADLRFTPKKGMKWQIYALLVEEYAQLNYDKSYKIHVNGKNGHWHTHEDPRGCFMCEDINLISVLRQVIQLMASRYPTESF